MATITGTSGTDNFFVTTAPTDDYNGLGGTDSLIMQSGGDPNFDLTSSVLTSVEKIVSQVDDTTFTVNQADLAKSGSVIGTISSNNNDLALANTEFVLNLTSTTLTNIQEIDFSGNGTGSVLTVDLADIKGGVSLVGSGNDDELLVKGTSFDLTSSSLSNVSQLQASSASATTFKLDADDLSNLSGGTINGSHGSDTIVLMDTDFDLSNINTNSVEILKAGASGGTTFTIDPNLVNLGTLGVNHFNSIIGSSFATDTLAVIGSSFDLTSTVLSSVEALQGDTSQNVEFILDVADLKGLTEIDANSGNSNGVFINKSATFDLSNVDLNGIGELGTTNVATSAARTITLGADTLGGSTGITIDASVGSLKDTLIASQGSLDVSQDNIDGFDILKASGAAPVTFTVDAGQLGPGGHLGSIMGTAKSDTLNIGGSTIDLTGTVLSSIEDIVTTGAAAGVTLDQADLAKGGTVDGTSGDVNLHVLGTVSKGVDTVDLSSTTLTHIASLDNNGNGANTVFKLANMAVPGWDGAATDAGSITGDAGNDTVMATGNFLDLTHTVLNSIENLTSGNAKGTEFLVDLDDITGVNLTGGKGSDSLVLGTDGANAFDVSTMALTSIEGIGVNTDLSAQTDTDITVSRAQLGTLKFISGNTGSSDSLQLSNSTDFNLTSVALTNIDVLNGMVSGANGTTFTVDPGDLTALASESRGAINGTVKADTLLVKGAVIDLTDIALSSIDKIGSTLTSALTFDLNFDTLNGNGAVTIQGSSKANDTIMTADTQLDLTSAVLNSVEILKQVIGTGGNFIIKDSFLAANGGSLASIAGDFASDLLLEVTGTAVDFTKTTLTGIDQLQADGTTITLDQADIFAMSGSKVIQELGLIADNSASPDTLLQVKAATIDLSHVDLSGIDILQSTGQAAGAPITFVLADDTLDGSQPNGPITIKGGTGVDKIQFNAQGGSDDLDLTSATLSSIEQLTSVNKSDVLFDITTADLVANGGSLASISGSAAGEDEVDVSGTSADFSQTTLSSIEILGALSDGTTFTVTAAELLTHGAKNAITQQLLEINDDFNGATGDVVQVTSNTIDVSSVSFDGIEVLRAAPGVSGPETFIVSNTTITDNSDDGNTVLTITGGTAVDTLQVAQNITLSSAGATGVVLSDIDILKFADTTGLGLTVDVNSTDLGGANGLHSIVGDAKGFDELSVNNNGADVDLTSTSFSQIEQINLDSGGVTVTLNTHLFDASLTEVNAVGSSDLILAGANSYDISGITFDGFNSLTEHDNGVSVTLAVSEEQIDNFGTFTGTAQDDTLVLNDSSGDFTVDTFSSIEVLKAGFSTATTFDINQTALDNLAANASGGLGSIIGGAGVDTLRSEDSAIDLSHTVLSSIETLNNASPSLQFNVTLSAENLTSLKLITAEDSTFIGNGSTLTVVGTAFDLSHTALSGIDILAADQTAGGTTFTLNQNDISVFDSNFGGVTQQLTAIDGDGDTTTTDTIQAAGTQLDLRSVALSDIEDITASHGSGVQYTLDGNAKSIDLDLTVNGHADSVTVTSGYLGVIDDTSATTLENTMLHVDNFSHAQDTIDISGLVSNGTAAFDNSPAVQTVANGATDLQDAVNKLGQTYDGTTNSEVVSFEFNGNTYVFVDNSDKGGFDATHDSVIQLTGTNLGVTASDLVMAHN